MTLGKLIGLLFCPPPPPPPPLLYFVFENSKNTRNELAHPLMGTSFLVRDTLLAKITWGISSGFGNMVAIITRINTQALMCSQIIHRENLLHTQHSRLYLHTQHSRYISLQGNNQQ